MTKFLESLGRVAIKQDEREAWYLSPLRDEKTASFKINKRHNVWYDFGVPIGGDIVDFACYYLKSKGEDHTISDALRYISNLGQDFCHFVDVKDRTSIYSEPKLAIKDIDVVRHIALIRYLERRGIAIDLAKKYLKELRLFNKATNSHLFALGLRNEEGGYDLRNPMFKGTVGKKSISFIRGESADNKGFHVFEGFFDFLSALSQLKKERFKEDAIILNSLSCLKYLAPYVKFHGYRKAYSWLDNDKAGIGSSDKLKDFCHSIDGLTFIKMNNVYSNFKDVNSWHVATIKNQIGV